MLGDEVPDALSLSCSLRTSLIGVEDLKKVVKDALLDVVGLEASLLIIG